MEQYFTVRGRRGTLSNLASYFGVVSPKVAQHRVREHKWEAERAVTTPATRRQTVYQAFGVFGTISFLTKKFSYLPTSTVGQRVRTLGWPIEKALTEPEIGKGLKLCRCGTYLPSALKEHRNCGSN